MPAIDMLGSPSMPTLEEIPEEPSEESSRSTSRTDTATEPDTRPASPYSQDSSMDGRRVFNFSRPRPFSPPPDQDEPWRTPTMQQSPHIGSQYRPRTGPSASHARSNGKSRQMPSQQSYYEDGDDDDDAAPPPVIRTFSEHRDGISNARGRNPQTLIYKPYADSVISDDETDATSILSQDTITTDDTDSIAESTTTDQSNFTFDGRLGWHPQRPSEREREKQRWAAPVFQPFVEEAERSNTLGQAGPQEDAQRDSWYSDSSTGTAQGTQTEMPHRPQAIPRRTSHKDVFEAAGERLGSLHAGAATRRQDLSRQGSSAGRAGASRTNMSNTTNGNRNSGLFHQDSSSSGEGQNRPSGGSTRSTSTTSVTSAEWKSSEFDISSLSEKKLAKLKKKGVNPALYLEMKQAKAAGGNRRGIGLLSGNSFLG